MGRGAGLLGDVRAGIPQLRHQGAALCVGCAEGHDPQDGGQVLPGGTRRLHFGLHNINLENGGSLQVSHAEDGSWLVKGGLFTKSVSEVSRGGEMS